LAAHFSAIRSDIYHAYRCTPDLYTLEVPHSALVSIRPMGRSPHIPGDMSAARQKLVCCTRVNVGGVDTCHSIIIASLSLDHVPPIIAAFTQPPQPHAYSANIKRTLGYAILLPHNPPTMSETILAPLKRPAPVSSVQGQRPEKRSKLTATSPTAQSGDLVGVWPNGVTSSWLCSTCSTIQFDQSCIAARAGHHLQSIRLHTFDDIHRRCSLCRLFFQM